jgi:hypothetical protein
MSIIRRNIRQIFGLEDDLQDLNSSLGMASAERRAADGELSELTSENKSSLVAAINAALTGIGNAGEAALQISQNLADLENVLTAQNNLGVYSTQGVLDAITTAQLDLGTNYRVEDITERDALTNLNTNDRVFVKDTGDGTWATYKPIAFEGGLATDWRLLSSQTSLENVITVDAIKARYEENEDTNAFTDADQEKVDHITVTQAVDLDDVALKGDLNQDVMEIGAGEGTVPAASAVVAYVDEITRVGGPVLAREAVTVAGSTITLTHAPRNGVHGIDNFSTVRFTNASDVSYDAPVIATAEPNEFVVSTSVEDEWDGEQVMVQYFYTGDVESLPELDENGYVDQGELPEPE